jgi:hypothetical protein
MASNSTSADTLDPAHAIAESPAVEIERDRRQSALRELADSESYSRVLFHATQTGLVIADLRTECIMEANPAASPCAAATASWSATRRN